MTEGWNHNIQYHELVLRSVPSPCARGLDVGCGQGALTRKLARRCGEIVGIDLDAVAEPALSGQEGRPANVQFLAGDVMTYPWAPASFNFIAAVATLHHLDLEAGIERLRSLLAPGGTLVVVGLYRENSVSDYALAALALPVSWLTRRVRGYAEMGAAARPPQETWPEIRAAAAKLLPGAEVKRRLFFRYTLTWRKP